MARDWLAVYTATLTKTKYRKLPIEARAALFHVWMMAGGQDPEARWEVDELRETLELDGYPATALDDLIRRGWLDVDGEYVWVHDWDQHQRAVTAKVRTAYERERKQGWRNRQKEAGQTPLSDNSLPDKTGISHDITVSPVVRDMSGTSWGTKWDQFLEVWVERWPGTRPTEKQRSTLWTLIDSRPGQSAQWLREAPANVRDFEAVSYVLGQWKAYRSSRAA